MINARRQSHARFRAVLFAFTALAAPTVFAAPTAVAQVRQAEQTYQFDVPAQSLPRALASVARTARLQLIFTDGEPSGVRAPALRGRMTANEAFNRLTAGSAFEAYYSAPGVVTLRSRPVAVEDDGSRVLGPVRVEGAQSTFAYSGGPVRGDGVAQIGGVRGGQDEEATGYRPNIASIGAGAPAPIEDIPRSISVLTQEQIQKQDIETLGDALRRLPGITLIDDNNSDLSTGSSVVSRGFAIRQVQIDGGASRPLNIIGNGLVDLGAYERVELVRGANGAFAAGGSPGGGLNLVRKRPGSSESLELVGTLGSFDRRAAQLDFSTPSVGGSAFAFRGVASVSDQNYFYENGAKRNALLYGIVDAPLGDRARLEFGAQYSRVNETAPYSGQFRYFDGPIIDFGGYYYNLAGAWSYDRSTSAETFARLYMEVLDNVDLEVGLDIQTGSQSRVRLGSVPLFLEMDGSALDARIYAGFQSYETYNQSFNFKLFGSRSFWGLKHDFLISGELAESGAPYSNERFGANSVSATNVEQYLERIRAFSPTYVPFPSSGELGGTSSRTGIFISDTISWRDVVSLSVSARRNAVETSGVIVSIGSDNGLPQSILLPETQSGEQTSDPRWVPTWSLSIKPWRNLTVYGTMAEGEEISLTPQYTQSGAVLGPTTYENLEGGLKFATDRWLASLAYYDLVQHNVAQPLFGTACPPSNSQSTPCYADDAPTIESRGVDLEIAGEILTGLSLQANYNWGESKITGGANSSTQSPVHSGQIFVDWSPAFWPNTSLRGGLRYRGEVYSAGYRVVLNPQTFKVIAEGPVDFTEEAYFVWDLGVQHQLTRNLMLDLFVENVTDEQYLSSIDAQDANFPGAPRTFTATLRWKADEGFLGLGSTTGRSPFGDPADWYGSIDLGVHAADDLDATGGQSQDGVTPINWTVQTEDGFAGAARIGYRFSPSVRAELEASFRTTTFGDIGGGAAAPFGVCGANYVDLDIPFDCDDANGDADAWALMANGLYDFGREDSRFRPYVGFGLGVVKTSIDFSGKLEGVGGDTPWNFDYVRKLQEGIAGDSTNMAFAYQALAGVSYQLTPQATLDLTYRYFQAPEIRWSSYNLAGVGGAPEFGSPIPGLTERVGDLRAAYKDQALTIGLRWAFGVR